MNTTVGTRLCQLTGCLFTDSGLRYRSNHCIICEEKGEPETVAHLLLHCSAFQEERKEHLIPEEAAENVASILNQATTSEKAKVALPLGGTDSRPVDGGGGTTEVRFRTVREMLRESRQQQHPCPPAHPPLSLFGSRGWVGWLCISRGYTANGCN